jgi:hypothetical protein
VMDTGFMEQPHHPYCTSHNYRNIQPVVTETADSPVS